MGQLTSAPALRTAREALKQFSMEVRPPESLPQSRIGGLRATERHVAILVDQATNAHRVVGLRPELRYWQTRLLAGSADPPQVAAFMKRVLDAFASVPRFSENETKITSVFQPPAMFAAAGMRPEVRVLSKHALEAARVLCYYYFVRPRMGTLSESLAFHRLADVVEVHLGLSRTMKIEEALRKRYGELLAGKASEGDLIKTFRRLGISFEYLPSYGDQREEMKLLS